ncbi:hypothetical protein D0Z07_5231 [Hyphodiscus hymeniophilus]|uniref:DUF2264 domain-containing protein n=1 Tax=Hyphodiscus hymeniophilus TaxID=353542 RepID=A0A9P6VHN1_9HELO|nr:hypothetical protein D0Z07_5231 [Hyphodiscus hymeniophilus]
MIDSSVVTPSRFNPLSANPFLTRDDVIAAVHGLFNPLLPCFSEGKARVQLDASGATCDRAACDLEGFARPLFGIAPMVAGGASFEHWDLYREGLKNGTDPQHPEYWGKVLGLDQRQVEAAALGYALLLVPQHIYEPLDDTAKSNLVNWLLNSRNGEHHGNNHKYFRVIVDLGLEKVGVEVNRQMTDQYLDDLDTLYIDDGWYRDGDDPGDTRRIDYYNPFAMHYYGLVYAKARPQDTERCMRYRDRARKFALHFQHWFADTGANVPYGRSLIYRQAVCAFWGALAVAGEEVLPWGVIKGLYLRNLRWWSSQPITRSNDGILTVGYAYPNQFMAERYNSSGSPWWALKAFTPLQLPSDHPFWTAEELPLTGRNTVAPMPVVGMVFCHQPGHTVLLTAGPETGQQMRFSPEKYKKFAYSSRYGFSIESDSRAFKLGAFDSIIAFSDDGNHYRVREHCVEAHIAGNVLFSLWQPWHDVKVETWLIPSGPWHIRVHRISSPRKLSTIEGGFAAPRTDNQGDEVHREQTSSWVLSKLGDFSGILDLSSSQRSARVNTPHGNTNLMFPRTLIPQLMGEVEANVPVTFACAVLAGPDGKTVNEVWTSPPVAPSVKDLEELFQKKGVQVEVTKPFVGLA